MSKFRAISYFSDNFAQQLYFYVIRVGLLTVLLFGQLASLA